MRTTAFTKIIKIFFVVIFFCDLAQAQLPWKSSDILSVSGGLASINNGGKVNGVLGVGYSKNVSNDYDYGIQLLYNNFLASTGNSGSILSLLGDTTYYLGSGFGVGLKLGVSSIAYNGSGAPVASYNFTYAPKLGYNYELSSHAVLGFELDYEGFATTNPLLNGIYGLASLKYGI